MYTALKISSVIASCCSSVACLLLVEYCFQRERVCSFQHTSIGFIIGSVSSANQVLLPSALLCLQIGLFVFDLSQHSNQFWKKHIRHIPNYRYLQGQEGKNLALQDSQHFILERKKLNGSFFATFLHPITLHRPLLA